MQNEYDPNEIHDDEGFVVEESTNVEKTPAKRGRPAHRTGRRTNLNMKPKRNAYSQKPNREFDKCVKEMRGDFSQPRAWNRQPFQLPRIVLDRFDRAGYMLKCVSMSDEELKLHEMARFVPVYLEEVPEWGVSILPSGSAYFNAYKNCCIMGDQILMKVRKIDFEPFQRHIDQERLKDKKRINQALENSDHFLNPHAVAMQNRIRPIDVNVPK